MLELLEKYGNNSVRNILVALLIQTDFLGLLEKSTSMKVPNLKDFRKQLARYFGVLETDYFSANKCCCNQINILRATYGTIANKNYALQVISF